MALPVSSSSFVLAEYYSIPFHFDPYLLCFAGLSSMWLITVSVMKWNETYHFICEAWQNFHVLLLFYLPSSLPSPSLGWLYFYFLRIVVLFITSNNQTLVLHLQPWRTSVSLPPRTMRTWIHLAVSPFPIFDFALSFPHCQGLPPGLSGSTLLAVSGSSMCECAQCSLVDAGRKAHVSIIHILKPLNC